MKPRNLSIVRVKEEYQQHYPELSGALLFFGEIPNMPDHCVVRTDDGVIHSGMHTENFRELEEDEV